MLTVFFMPRRAAREHRSWSNSSVNVIDRLPL